MTRIALSDTNLTPVARNIFPLHGHCQAHRLIDFTWWFLPNCEIDFSTNTPTTANLSGGMPCHTVFYSGRHTVSSFH
jgi:hypothetical protein